MRLFILACFAVLLALPSPSYAQHDYSPSVSQVQSSARHFKATKHVKHARSAHVRERGKVVAMLAKPSHCPSRAFCGCGAAYEVFGRNVRELWLARNWYKFPRSVPAPKMAAVKEHHVFVLKEHRKGLIWLVADYNSGGHRSRLHYRSIAGYTIVNPRGSKYASL